MVQAKDFLNPFARLERMQKPNKTTIRNNNDKLKDRKTPQVNVFQ